MFFGSKVLDTPERFFQQQQKKNQQPKSMHKYRHGARWVLNYIGVRLKIGILLNICLYFTFHHFQFCIAVLKIMLKKGFISINNRFFFKFRRKNPIISHWERDGNSVFETASA